MIGRDAARGRDDGDGAFVVAERAALPGAVAVAEHRAVENDRVAFLEYAARRGGRGRGCGGRAGRGRVAVVQPVELASTCAP